MHTPLIYEPRTLFCIPHRVSEGEALLGRQPLPRSRWRLTSYVIIIHLSVAFLPYSKILVIFRKI